MPSEGSGAAVWLNDIRHNIRLAATFVDGMNYAEFCENDLVFYGVTRCLEIISEASRRLPPDLKYRYPVIPWHAIAAAGNVYRHEYENLRHWLVWGTVTEQLPELLAVVEKEIAELDKAKGED